MAIPFVKKVFNIGMEFYPEDMNDIQDQYEAASIDINITTRTLARGFTSQIFEGDGVEREFILDSPATSPPMVFFKALGQDYAALKQVGETNDPAYFAYWDPDSPTIVNLTNNPATPLAGEVVEIYYITGIGTHASTHATGGSDPLTPDDIGAYSKSEIDTLLSECIDEAEATTIAEGVKASADYACNVRINPATLAAGEIAFFSS